MRGSLFLALLALAACGTSNAVTSAHAAAERGGWQLASGKAPTKAEFAAVLAACEDRAKGSQSAVDGCLVDYGLRPVR